MLKRSLLKHQIHICIYSSLIEGFYGHSPIPTPDIVKGIIVVAICLYYIHSQYRSAAVKRNPRKGCDLTEKIYVIMSGHGPSYNFMFSAASISFSFRIPFRTMAAAFSVSSFSSSLYRKMLDMLSSVSAI